MIFFFFLNDPFNVPSFIFITAAFTVFSAYRANVLTLTSKITYVCTSATFDKWGIVIHPYFEVILQMYMNIRDCTYCNLLSNLKYNIYLLIKQCMYVWYEIFSLNIRVILKEACLHCLSFMIITVVLKFGG